VIDDKLVLWNHFTGDGERSPQGHEATDDPVLIKLCVTAFEE